MQKTIRLFSCGVLFFSSLTLAHAKPVATLSLGVDNVTINQTNTNVIYIPPFYNTYAGSNESDTQLLGGIFLGTEFDFRSLWDWQLGLSYYSNSAFLVQGQVYEFGLPAYNSVGYEYDVQSQRALVETKLLYTLRKIFHPYVDVGIGESFNLASNYMEYPITSDGAPMSQPFGSKSMNNFTYLVGLGVDMDVTHYLRVGFGYRYADLGKAGLGTTPLEQDTATLKNKFITSNEFLLQISAVC